MGACRAPLMSGLRNKSDINITYSVLQFSWRGIDYIVVLRLYGMHNAHNRYMSQNVILEAPEKSTRWKLPNSPTHGRIWQHPRHISNCVEKFTRRSEKNGFLKLQPIGTFGERSGRRRIDSCSRELAYAYIQRLPTRLQR